MNWNTAFTKSPLIAILRGITPDKILSVCEILIEEQFVIIEVPLNSPQAFESIQLAASSFGGQAIFGAGTVLLAHQVQSVKDAGGKLIIAPNLDFLIGEEAKKHDMIYCPGVGTATEAFKALGVGAHVLKLFPAEMISPPTVKALRAVLPSNARLLPVGGIDLTSLKIYMEAGANGFGIGSALYHPTFTLSEIRNRASLYRQTFDILRN